ncbi:hypothetical protein BC826DRAFT_186982 [Russula brevipes]|nr:hypothetical protein BC826DRAFT_186982 [Russula brevipes]
MQAVRVRQLTNILASLPGVNCMFGGMTGVLTITFISIGVRRAIASSNFFAVHNSAGRQLEPPSPLQYGTNKRGQRNHARQFSRFLLGLYVFIADSIAQPPCPSPFRVPPVGTVPLNPILYSLRHPFLHNIRWRYLRSVDMTIINPSMLQRVPIRKFIFDGSCFGTAPCAPAILAYPTLSGNP